VKVTDDLKEATLQRRLSRFSALVTFEGREEIAYLANSGRLETLLLPGQKVYLAARAGPGRKTKYDLALVSLNQLLVSVDARMPGLLLEEAFHDGKLPQFHRYLHLRREAVFGHSRLDFLLSGEGQLCLVEAKSVTLVRQGLARFPDAPTERGRRHLESLVQAQEKGYEASIIFVAQREDAHSFYPHDEVDPLFGRALREAAARGVRAYAYNCKVSLTERDLFKEIPVYL
jgi:sugar fermentation stimulation protein A